MYCKKNYCDFQNISQFTKYFYYLLCWELHPNQMKLLKHYYWYSTNMRLRDVKNRPLLHSATISKIHIWIQILGFFTLWSFCVARLLTLVILSILTVHPAKENSQPYSCIKRPVLLMKQARTKIDNNYIQNVRTTEEYSRTFFFLRKNFSNS